METRWREARTTTQLNTKAIVNGTLPMRHRRRRQILRRGIQPHNRRLIARIQTRIQILIMATRVQDGQGMIAVGGLSARSLLPIAPPPAGLLGALILA